MAGNKKKRGPAADTAFKYNFPRRDATGADRRILPMVVVAVVQSTIRYSYVCGIHNLSQFRRAAPFVEKFERSGTVLITTARIETFLAAPNLLWGISSARNLYRARVPPLRVPFSTVSLNGPANYRTTEPAPVISTFHNYSNDTLFILYMYFPLYYKNQVNAPDYYLHRNPSYLKLNSGTILESLYFNFILIAGKQRRILIF